MANLEFETKLGALTVEDIRKAAMLYTSAVITELEKRKKQKSDEQRDYRLHNTKMLLRNYRRFVGFLDTADFKIDEIEEAETREWFRNMYDPSNRSDQIVLSIKSAAIKTRVIVEHIKTVIKAYKEYCDAVGTDISRRRYGVIYGKYISPTPMAKEDLAKKWFVDGRTVQRDLKAAEHEISSLMFGIDFIDATGSGKMLL